MFFGEDFVTVSRHAGDLEWRQLKAPILAAMMDHFTSGAPLYVVEGEAAGGHDGEDVYEGETAQIVTEIKDLLDSRVRPAVGPGRRRHPVQPLRRGHRRRLSAYEGRLLRLPLLRRHAEGGGWRTC